MIVSGLDKVRARIQRNHCLGDTLPMIPQFGSESWKYTDLRALSLAQFSAPRREVSSQAASSISLAPSAIVDNGFVNIVAPPQGGVSLYSLKALYAESHPSELVRTLLEEHLGSLVTVNEDNAYVRGNNDWLEDGVVVFVPKNTAATAPVVICHKTSAGVCSYPRVLIVAESGAKVSVVETFEGEALPYVTIPVTEVIAHANASVTHTKIQAESTAAYHLATLCARADRDAHVVSHLVTVGGATVRNDIATLCAGTGGNISLYGLTVINGTQHVDNATLLDHALPHCESRELYKGIYAGESKGVFTGTIIVREDAQKTNAFQQNQTILLSPKAEINSRPQLKIWADDVKCTHGATVGQLDKEALFYMLSRGIAHADAQALLVKAFAGEVMATITDESVRACVDALIDTKLQACVSAT